MNGVFRNAARFARGQFAFNREFTANPANRGGTADGMAEFMLGLAAGGTVGNENGELLTHRSFAMFFQDDWKITNRLTLNLGVRYDVFFAPVFPEGKVSTFELNFADVSASARLKQIRFQPGDCNCDNDLNNIRAAAGPGLQGDQ